MSFKTGNWWISPHNFSDDVRRRWSLPSKITIHDCTLRDGEQMAGLVFSKDEKIAIAKMMDAAGIHRIEVGMPLISKDDADAMKALANEGLGAKIMCLARALKQDIDAAAECNVSGIVLEVPSSGHLQRVLGWEPEDAIKKAVDATIYAKSRGLYVAIFPWDSTRADLNYYLRLAKAAVVEGHADSAAFVDTLGVTLPDAVFELVKRVKATLKCPIEIHCHNDFGLGTADALAAVEAGAEVVNCSFNGIGERCGNTSTEEVCFALQVLYGMDVGVKMEKFKEISRAVEKASGITLPPQKPVVGDNVTTYEAGIVVDIINKANLLGQDELIMTPYKSQIVGNTGFRLKLGKKSGKGSIEWKLRELGAKSNPELVDSLLSKVKERGIKLKRALTDDEFKELLKGELSHKQASPSE